MRVVADTSALLALAACDGLRLLDALFQAVQVPRAVFRECTVPGKPEAEQLAGYLRDKVAEIDLAEFVIAAAGIGQGELEAIAWFMPLWAGAWSPPRSMRWRCEPILPKPGDPDNEKTPY